MVTNGVDTLAALAAKGVNVYSSGGKVYSENNAALTGEFARAAISKIHADLCFFSVHGITSDAAFTICFGPATK